MNIVLFDRDETQRPLPVDDPRARHVLTVLRRKPGDAFDAGIIDGPRGKATVLSVGETALELAFEWGGPPPPLEPIALIVGLSRPQTARKILEEATALGVCAIHFVATGRSDAGYARSKLWTTDEWRRHLIEGASQAFSTRLPHLTSRSSLAEAVAQLPPSGCRLALDNYEATSALAQAAVREPVAVAVGPERGWSADDRDILRGAGFELVHLGERVLRVETACVAAVSLVKASLGRY